MAIVQISRITNRKGLQQDLPQLAGAELGWSIDERRLFIGNGTIADGAPVVGNTEILTQFSDILAFQTTYTYKGEAAGYTVQTGPTPGTPISQSLQSWLDQWASVKDFGAVGDGVTDDTEAINRALYQIFCREVNPQIRRALFFPAGVYLINQSIVIPPFATLYGEGADNSVIRMTAGDDSALRAYVARTGDSLQQTGTNIGSNGAITPQYVTIDNLGFESLDDAVDIFLIEYANNCKITNTNFAGPLTTSDLTTDIDNISCIRFNSSAALVCSNNIFDKCSFSGTTYAFNTDVQLKSTTVSNSSFDTLYRGIEIGTGTPVLGGPTGFRVVQNSFDNIYEQGVLFGDISLNATGHNVFYDVGNHFNGYTSPASTIIKFNQSNNISIGDMFERTDDYADVYSRIYVAGTSSIGIVNGKYLELGSSTIASEAEVTLTNNSTDETLYTFDATVYRSVTLNYSITRNTGVRHGSFVVTPTGGGTLNYTDDYTENESVGVTLSASQTGDTVTILYTTTNTGVDGSAASSITTYRV